MTIFPPTTLSTAGVFPGRMWERGYDLPADLSFERWLEIGERLQLIERSVKWWLGDWWNYGERKYGEMASQASKDHVEDITGYAYHTVINAAVVAKKFESSRRREDLSWSHHDAVAVLPIVEADAMLDAVASEGLNVFATRDRVRSRKESLRGQAVTLDGDPIETADLPWHATIDDLTNDARASLSAYAPQGRFRTAWVAGYLRALQWAGVESAFLPGRFKA